MIDLGMVPVEDISGVVNRFRVPLHDAILAWVPLCAAATGQAHGARRHGPGSGWQWALGKYGRFLASLADACDTATPGSRTPPVLLIEEPGRKMHPLLARAHHEGTPLCDGDTATFLW